MRCCEDRGIKITCVDFSFGRMMVAQTMLYAIDLDGLKDWFRL